MANDGKSQNDLLKRAQAASGAAAKPLALAEAQRKAANEARGFDPYNTSGSFDRKKNWSRVGRR